jgi:glucose-1-phosphate thymidylyltransferase
MKGLILAGGSGTRLRPITYTGAKQLVPVANRPIIFYVVDKLVEAGILDIGVVVSHESSKEIKNSLGDGSHWGVKFTFIQQDKPLGLAHAVGISHGFLGEEDFCLFLGDNLIGSSITQEAQTFQSSSSDAFLMLKKIPDPSSCGVVELGTDGSIIGLEEKPKNPKSDLALIGVYFFRKSIFPLINSLSPSPRGEYEITDAISSLIQSGKQVSYGMMNSWWLDTGKKDDLLRANDTVLDDMLKTDINGNIDQYSSISGRVSIGPGSQIIRSRIRGPVAIGENVTLVDANINPFTCLGDSVKVERSTIEHCVVMEGSKIIDIPRLEDSLIGRRVLLHPGAANYGSINLLVGDDCKIELNRRSM